MEKERGKKRERERGRYIEDCLCVCWMSRLGMLGGRERGRERESKKRERDRKEALREINRERENEREMERKRE
jgi:hypothetical protein